MPTNLYGIGDNYDSENSHVVPALIKKLHEAKTNKLEKVKIWGSGEPLREFLFVDDLASACVHIMNLEKEIYESYTNKMLGHINVGSGEELKIIDLAKKIAKAVGFEGLIETDKSKPDGTPRKLLDSSKLINSGWKFSIKLEDGLRVTYKDFLDNYS